MVYADSDAHMARRIRSLGLKAIAATGLPLLALRRKRNRGTIVLYHGVTREQGDGIFNYRGKFVHTDSFEAHIAWLKQHFTTLPLQDLIASLGHEHEKPALAITFDDGYANNYTDAYPILRDAGVPATFFVTSGFVDGTPLSVDRLEYALATDKDRLVLELPDRSWSFPLTTRTERIGADRKLRRYVKLLPPAQKDAFFTALVAATGRDLTSHLRTTPYAPMTWEHMREMLSHGMSFAAHTVTHPILAELTREETRGEIRRSHTALLEHGLSPLPTFAYPNGGPTDFSDETIAALRELGFTASLTTRPGDCTNDHDRFRLPRYTLDGANKPYRLSMVVSGLQQTLREL